MEGGCPLRHKQLFSLRRQEKKGVGMRRKISFNEGWEFSKDGISWQKVTLPHTWNAVDGQDGGNDYWRGCASYRKEFDHVPGENRVFLEINGAFSIAEVFLNGTNLVHHAGGYSTFRTDLTDKLQAKNVLLVQVDNSANDYVYPQKADFTFYGGLYRDVNLIEVPRHHFDLTTDGTPGIHVTPIVKGTTAYVTVETRQCGEGDVTMTVAGMVKRVPSDHGCAKAMFEIGNVHLWNGVEDPFLYEAKAEFGGDCVMTKFGCRSFAFDPEKGFILNGKVYPLRGVSRHQDRWGLGNALTIREHQEDMDLIREIGANAIRLAHYQHAQEFYDLCDEYGMIVWAEIPYITEHMPKGRQNTLDQMRELITQCYNHPSIVCWGLSNEIAVHGVSDDLIENHRLLNDLCHQMDPTRPTAMAHAFMLEQDSPLVSLPDVSSYNLYFGWYLGTLEQNDQFFDNYHAKYPDRVMGFSEYGADANVQFQSAHPQQGDYSEQYQCLYHEYILGCIDRHPWLWSTFCWNMFDFAADGRDEGGAHGLNQKGLVSFDRKTRKDAFYLYKAAWNHTDPFVHICGRRYVNRTEDVSEVRVYSNCREVTLLVDGKELDKKEGNRVFVFQVPLHGDHVIAALTEGCRDEIRVRRVSEPDPSYCLTQDTGVTNWFDEDGFDSSCYSIRDSLGTLLANSETAPIVSNLMQKMVASRGDVAKSANANANLQKMLAGMSLESLLKKAGDAVSSEMVKALNDRLQRVHK